MKHYRSEIVKQAQAWVGRKESDGSHKEIIDVYNSHKPLARGYKLKYTSAWCSGFASAVAIKCGYTDIIPTEVSCEKHIELFKKIGCWVEDDAYAPAAGDYIFYDWDDTGKGDTKGWSDHVGIVEKVSGSTITVIEGNYSNAVTRRSIKVNAKYIRGYGVPKYDAAAPEEPKPVEPTPTPEPKPTPTKLKYAKGDKVVLNGYLYKDSYGNGRGAKKTNYNGTITSTNSAGTKPYHIDTLGWVAESSLSKPKTIVHTVVKGDTLWKLGKKYNVKWTEIAKANDIKFPKYIIRTGQKLVIPKQ